MTSSRLQFIVFIALGLTLFACSGGNQENKKENSSSDTVNTTKDSSKPTALKVYTLPAPMQLPSLLHKLSAKFSQEFLKPSDNLKPGASDNKKEALILGMFGVDMGYCILYNQSQASMNYMSKMARLASDLNITGAFESSVVERLKTGVNNTDSATFILLNAFINARKFLSTNKREEVGYIIAAGSFIEGLHMLTSVAADNKSDEVRNLIGEQKMFLENITELLQNYSNDEGIKAISDKLADLKKDFDMVKIETVKGEKEDQLVVKSITISDEQVKSITQKVSAMRKEILQ
jgi:hypothetical protein